MRYSEPIIAQCISVWPQTWYSNLVKFHLLFTLFSKSQKFYCNKQNLLKYTKFHWLQSFAENNEEKNKLIENRRVETKGQLYWMDEDIGCHELDDQMFWKNLAGSALVWWKDEKLITQYVLWLPSKCRSLMLIVVQT